jgi:molecular chaperone HtpG
VNLYCRKVLIQPRAKGLFPDWLRFLKGVVDSEDFLEHLARDDAGHVADAKTQRVLTAFIKFLEEQVEKDAQLTKSFSINLAVSLRKA